jgi:hypothetical protein
VVVVSMRKGPANADDAVVFFEDGSKYPKF